MRGYSAREALPVPPGMPAGRRAAPILLHGQAPQGHGTIAAARTVHSGAACTGQSSLNGGPPRVSLDGRGASRRSKPRPEATMACMPPFWSISLCKATGPLNTAQSARPTPERRRFACPAGNACRAARLSERAQGVPAGAGPTAVYEAGPAGTAALCGCGHADGSFPALRRVLCRAFSKCPKGAHAVRRTKRTLLSWPAGWRRPAQPCAGSGRFFHGPSSGRAVRFHREKPRPRFENRGRASACILFYTPVLGFGFCPASAAGAGAGAAGVGDGVGCGVTSAS